MMRPMTLVTMALAFFAPLVFAQQPGPAGRAAPAVDSATKAESTGSVKVESVWDFVLKGGPVMIPIGICSLVALTVIVERLISLRKRQVIPPQFLPGLSKILETSDDHDRALEYCKARSSPISNIVTPAIKRLGEPVAVLEKGIQEAGEREVVKLKKYLRLLSVIASISPLLGLLGTIFGMITAFQTVAASGEALGRTELLAKGIYEAMITTAAGLMVAIPVLIAYHGLSAKVDGLVHEMDRLLVELLETIASPARGAVGAPRRAFASVASQERVSESHDGRVTPDAAVALVDA